MNNRPTAIEYLAQDITRLSVEKALLQEALYAERAKSEELEHKLADLEERLTAPTKKGVK